MSESLGYKRNTGSLIVSAMFVVAGLITLWDTTGYTDRDSQVFPQTVAVILIITAGISLVVNFIKPTASEGFGPGDWWRRVLFVVTMFVTCYLLPLIGFLPAAGVAFAGGLVAAMHDRWSVKTLLLYWGFGAIVTIAVYSLFKFALKVPLP